ncbi:MAG: calcium/sodium antiporter [Chloroflexi bacterium]|nr:calcium/sodium antiporter [Chloroflexota bacterium]
MPVRRRSDAHQREGPRVILSIVLLSAGFVVLMVGGNVLVRAAGRMALGLGMAPVVVGATVVAFGTSMPELMVSVVGVLTGSPGVAAGNVIGSNITNILLVLGLAAVIAPMSVHQRILAFDIPVVLVVTGWALLIFADGTVSRVEGIGSLIALAVLIVAQLRWFSASDAPTEMVELEGVPLPDPDDPPRMVVEIPLAVLAIGALAAGSSLFVAGATDLAERAGISEFAIGATVVALGTSLPEVVTSCVAAWKREHDIAIGNVIGSNIFNVLAVMGATATVRPVETSQDLYMFEMPVLALSTLVLAPLVWRRFRIGRTEGILLLVGYVAFTIFTLQRGSGGVI